MGKYRYKKPKLSATSSTVPAIYGMRNYVEMMNTLVYDVPGRIDEGRWLFLLSMAEFVKKEIQRRAPDLDMGGEKFPYAEHLRVGIVDGVNDMEAVAIYFENQSLVLESGNMDGKVLFFQPTERSPKWVNVLMIYGPWPSHMMPVPKEDLYARVITRNAREDELKALADRIYVNRGKIESDLRRAGAPNVKIGKTSNAIGVVVYEDVGYNILRSEFGLAGSEQVAHWRPALRAIKEVMPDMMKRFLKYLKTGRKGVFELPHKIDHVSGGKLRKSSRFMRTLAPFVPKG